MWWASRVRLDLFQCVHIYGIDSGWWLFGIECILQAASSIPRVKALHATVLNSTSVTSVDFVELQSVSSF